VATKIFISIYVWALTISFIRVVITGSYGGELCTFNVGFGQVELYGLYILNLMSFLFIYFAYKLASSIHINAHVKFKINSKLLTHVIFVVCFLHILFVTMTGVGRVGSGNKNDVSFLFNMLDPKYIFPLFYVLVKSDGAYYAKTKVKFYAVVVSYCILKIVQGWSGYLLLIALLEAHFFFKNRQYSKCNEAMIVMVAPLILMVAGGLIYKHAYEVKTYIRGAQEEISYGEGVDKFVNRLTFFPNSLGAIERHSDISNLYTEQGVGFKEVKGIFRPVLPSLIVGDKSYRSINNLSVQAFYPDVTAVTGSDIGLLAYTLVLLNIDVGEWAVWFAITATLTFLYKVFLDALGGKEFNILMFLLFLKVGYTASLEFVFGYGYLGLLYWIVFSLLSGVMNIQVQRR